MIYESPYGCDKEPCDDPLKMTGEMSGHVVQVVSYALEDLGDLLKIVTDTTAEAEKAAVKYLKYNLTRINTAIRDVDLTVQLTVENLLTEIRVLIETAFPGSVEIIEDAINQALNEQQQAQSITGVSAGESKQAVSQDTAGTTFVSGQTANVSQFEPAATVPSEEQAAATPESTGQAIGGMRQDETAVPPAPIPGDQDSLSVNTQPLVSLPLLPEVAASLAAGSVRGGPIRVCVWGVPCEPEATAEQVAAVSLEQTAPNEPLPEFIEPELNLQEWEDEEWVRRLLDYLGL